MSASFSAERAKIATSAAFAREQLGSHAPDAARRAGDDDGTIGEFALLHPHIILSLLVPDRSKRSLKERK